MVFRTLHIVIACPQTHCIMPIGNLYINNIAAKVSGEEYEEEVSNGEEDPEESEPSTIISIFSYYMC